MIKNKKNNSLATQKSVAERSRSSVDYLKFIFANKYFLLKHKNGAKHFKAMEDIAKTENRKFTPKQLSYIDDVYEMVMRELGFPSYKGQKSKYGVNLKC
ncbi:MAG: hypothetical protein KKF62_14100 [Bacteroidetes bacterium]|nr:hypothetical protein [Bacteroidota bacterium]MBU1114200.1 hypothetical protein [Bacteroidota bacterium]MBU1797010.1 hypothetical protein [Bacteroidota bacterium]